jgi:hypothetical protein
MTYGIFLMFFLKLFPLKNNAKKKQVKVIYHTGLRGFDKPTKTGSRRRNDGSVQLKQGKSSGNTVYSAVRGEPVEP